MDEADEAGNLMAPPDLDTSMVVPEDTDAPQPMGSRTANVSLAALLAWCLPTVA